MRIFLLVIVAASLLFGSCRTQNRIIYNYLEDSNDTTVLKDVLIKEPVIQKNDLLHIMVYSESTDPTIDPLFNLPMTQNAGGGGSNQTQLTGFLVDANGYIKYPRIGDIKAEGLTKSELAVIIQDKLKEQLQNPTVLIRFMNFRVTVLGEVGNAGVLNIQTEKLTLLEALGMAGDITEFGKKTAVRVIRESNGKREIGVIDMTSQTMFESPYYMLQQNDVVLVEQTKYKVQQTEQDRVVRQIGLVTGIITAGAFLLNIFK